MQILLPFSGLPTSFTETREQVVYEMAIALTNTLMVGHLGAVPLAAAFVATARR